MRQRRQSHHRRGDDSARRSSIAIAVEQYNASLPILKALIQNVDRIFDLLFVARAIDRAGNAPDVLWQRNRTRGASP